ncbi:MAG: alpha-amylase family glycosyl hydrolase [Rectinemataceae bacterium]
MLRMKMDADSGAARLRTECLTRLRARFARRGCDWDEFESRLESEFDRLAGLLHELYGGNPDFAYWLEEVVADSFGACVARSNALRKRDREIPAGSGWFSEAKQVGAVCYVDRWAGDFRGIARRIPYLKELGISYLHLMPFFRCPENENDGGYAVSSYRETDPALGTMADLEDLAACLSGEGIALVADFIFNHTSDGHEWALAARSGDAACRDMYLTFPDRTEPDEYSRTLRDIFPEARRGSFTWNPEMARWVWTTFHSFQWDLNYRNPAVFAAMAREMTSLANRGIAVLRLDAVAFIWKEKGTSCENLPHAHTIIRAFRAVADLACPSLLFKSEAIVHPDDIVRYIDPGECRLSYNPLLMAELWEAAATKEVRLLAHSLRRRHSLPPGCAWVNYVRCHDDIGWTFADEDAADLGIKGGDHRNFLNRFYMGDFPGSFAHGLSFQYNPVTGDRRICGTAASLAGIERAVRDRPGEDGNTALARLILLYGIAYSAGGIPLLYLGDELAAENDPDWDKDPDHAGDSRWAHRPRWQESLAAERRDTSTVTGKAFAAFAKMAALRASHPVFGVQELEVLESGHPSVLIFRKKLKGETLIVAGSFSESRIELPPPGFLSGPAVDLLSGSRYSPGESLSFEPCALRWLYFSSP